MKKQNQKIKNMTIEQLFEKLIRQKEYLLAGIIKTKYPCSDRKSLVTTPKLKDIEETIVNLCEAVEDWVSTHDHVGKVGDISDISYDLENGLPEPMKIIYTIVGKKWESDEDE